MLKALALLVLLVFTFCASPAQMQDSNTDFPAVVVPNTQVIPLTSTTNGHDYEISVALPNSYGTSGQSYPVLYLLDPSFAFLTVTEFTRGVAVSDQLPELLIVGVGYPPDTDFWQSRARDYYISQDEFLTFLDQELIPLIDSTYRTNRADRALVGFSYGGEFVIHTLVTKPETFNRYVAIDFDMAGADTLMQLLIRDDDEFRARFVGRDVKVFIAAHGQTALSSAIEAKAYDGLSAVGFVLPNDLSHEASLHYSLPAGLLGIYAD